MTARPLVLAISGPPASGKTTLGRELARRLGAALLDLDSLTNPLVDVIAMQLGVADYSDPRLSGAVREARYASLLGAATDCVGAGTSVVMVAPFTREKSAAGWAGLAGTVEAAGGEARLVWLDLSAAEIHARMSARGESRDQAKVASVAALTAAIDLTEPQVTHIRVDASLPTKEQGDAVLSELRA